MGQTIDPHRPRYHFIPPANWMNDPNGPIQWRGKYHLFYQHNPVSPGFGPMHWGHAESEDLVNWKHLPIALSPTPDGPDKDGCWTGCAVDNNGVPTLIYTGVHPEVQCVAAGSDDMLTWSKHSGNPVIAGPPPGLDVTGFRDPCVWREADSWYMALGSGLKGEGAAVLLYRSPDLVYWQYLHPLLLGNKDETGEMWECPDFFPLGGSHVLLVSVLSTTLYFIGRYEDLRFVPEVQGNTDLGGHFYAAKSFGDVSGRRILWGWIWEARTEDAVKQAGWAGVMSLPRILTLEHGPVLGMAPAPEVESLRGDHLGLTDTELEPDRELQVEGIGGDTLEIAAEIDPGDAEEVSLKMRCAPDGTEETALVYRAGDSWIGVDRRKSSLNEATTRDVRGGKLDLHQGEQLRLRVFVDCSVLEVFANGRACLTSRIYPTRPNSLDVKLLAKGGKSKVLSLDVWRMRDARIE
ncbi:MAG: glycoside hydrolase family 32 protein [Armatimonadota bacterium]